MIWIAFGVGLFVGTFVGIFTLALCAMAARCSGLRWIESDMQSKENGIGG